VNEAIYQALITKLKTVPGLPPLQLENTLAKVSDKTAFSRATLIRTRPQQLTMGVTGSDLHAGLLQVDLFVPLNTGTTAVNTLADAVIAAFPRGTTLPVGARQVRIRMAYRETAGRMNDQFHQVPVVVEWQSVI
jgi:hypothetical protein